MTEITLQEGVSIILPDEIKNVTPETAEEVMQQAIATPKFIEPFFQSLEAQFAPGSIKINGARDQEGYDRAKEAKKTLQKIRTATQKICKSQRDEWNKLAKESTTFENGLVGRVEVMEEAIKAEIEAVDAVISKERLEEEATAKLPFRTQILTEAGIEVLADAYKYLNDVEFQTFYNEQRTLVLDAKQKQIDEDKKKQDEIERAAEIEKTALENAKKEIRSKSLLAIGFTLSEDKTLFVHPDLEDKVIVDGIDTLTEEEFGQFCSDLIIQISTSRQLKQKEEDKKKADLNERQRRNDILLAMKFKVNADATGFTQTIGDITIDLTTEYIYSLDNEEFGKVQLKTANEIIDANSKKIEADKQKTATEAVAAANKQREIDEQKKKDDEIAEQNKKAKEAQEETRRKALLPDKEKLEKFMNTFQAFLLTCPDYPILQSNAGKEQLKYFEDCCEVLKKRVLENTSKL